MNLRDYVITLKKADPKEVLARVSTNISDDDLRRYFGEDIGTHIIKYSELSNYETIEDLLPHDKAFKIILFENDMNTGHWILLMRYGRTIEFFNSYGLRPNADFAFVSKIKNFFLGQSPDLLKTLLDDAKQRGYDVVYNKRKFQVMKKGINTCGRWIILRIILMTSLNQDLQGFIHFIDHLTEKYEYTPDILVSHLII